jgi:hypothetical protein
VYTAGAHSICVVSKGRIAEQGTHAELLAMHGIYKQLVARQLAGLHNRDADGSSPDSSLSLSAACEAEGGDAVSAPTS